MIEIGLKPGDRIPRGGGALLTHEWPEDCGVQGGTRGLVISRSHPDGKYFTPFFEAFPNDPKTFIRGEGKTVEEAEEDAWQKWQRYLNCPGPKHEFEPRGYTNGAGFCKHCGLFQSEIFSPEQLDLTCEVCGVWTFYARRKGKFYCQEHAPKSRFEDLL